MPKKQTRNTKKTKKLRIPRGVKFALAVALVALLTFGVLSLMRHLSDEKRAIDNQQEKNTAELYEDTPSDVDEDAVSDAGADRKDQAAAEEDSRSEAAKNSAGKTIALPIINYVGVEGDKVVAGGTISNVVETSGVCNFVFVKESQTITRTTGVLPNAKNTVCEAVEISKSEFSAGVWRVTLSYESNSAEGQSEATTFEVK